MQKSNSVLKFKKSKKDNWLISEIFYHYKKVSVNEIKRKKMKKVRNIYLEILVNKHNIEFLFKNKYIYDKVNVIFYLIIF